MLPNLEFLKLGKKCFRSASTVTITHCTRLEKIEMDDDVFLNCSRFVLSAVPALQSISFSRGNMKKLSTIGVSGEARGGAVTRRRALVDDDHVETGESEDAAVEFYE